MRTSPVLRSPGSSRRRKSWGEIGRKGYWEGEKRKEREVKSGSRKVPSSPSNARSRMAISEPL